MVALVLVGGLVFASSAAMLLGGQNPRSDDRVGFEQHPGVGGGWPGGPVR